jgi:hypothetical protein
MQTFEQGQLNIRCWALASNVGFVFQGTVADPRYPYAILGVLCVTGAICASLLPETLNEKLPETIHDASHFGIDQKFWSLPQRKKNKDYQSAPTKQPVANL